MFSRYVLIPLLVVVLFVPIGMKEGRADEEIVKAPEVFRFSEILRGIWMDEVIRGGFDWGCGFIVSDDGSKIFAQPVKRTKEPPWEDKPIGTSIFVGGSNLLEEPDEKLKASARKTIGNALPVLEAHCRR